MKDMYLVKNTEAKRFIAGLLTLKPKSGITDGLWRKLEIIGIKDLIRTAKKNRVMPLLFNKMRQLGLEERIRPEIWQKFALKYQKKTARNVIIKHVLKDAISSFNQSNVKAVMLKGAIIFCERIYPNPYTRSMVDLDIFIKKEDFPEVRKCLLDAGFIYTGGRVPYDLHEDYEKKGVTVELHYLPIPKKCVNLFDVDAFWESTIEVEIDGLKTNIPDPTDQIYHSFVHTMIRHQELINFQIQDLYDFLMITQYYKERIDWEVILDRVKKNGIGPLFTYYCWLITRNFNIKLPGPLNGLAAGNSGKYEIWYDRLKNCPGWTASAGERLMLILVKGGSILNHIKNTYKIVIKESVFDEPDEFLASIYGIEKLTFLLPPVRIIHLFRILFLHIFIIMYFVKKQLSNDT